MKSRLEGFVRLDLLVLHLQLVRFLAITFSRVGVGGWSGGCSLTS